MERIVAIKRLRKLLGNGFGYRFDPEAPTPEEREEAKASLPALTAEKQQAEKAMQDRKRAVLDADREYQELVAAWRSARDRANKAAGTTYRFKVTVSTTVAGGLFQSVQAQGDSWEDVIRQISAKR